MPKQNSIQKIIISCLFVCFAQFFFAPEIQATEEKALVKKIEFIGKNNVEIFLSKTAHFKSFTLENPPRLVVDIEDASLEKADYTPPLPSFVKNFRNRQNEKNLRLVFEMTQNFTLKKSHFERLKNETYGKIFIDLSGIKSDEKTATIAAKKEEKKPVKKIVVIDAGHGGKDPGTIGVFARSKEKNITLSYAKELAKKINLDSHYKAFLTRDDDFFIPLKKRVEKARKMKADLFISLHVNSIDDASVSGFSIYTLSEKSSDKQAELLAQKENRADIIAGMNFSGASQDVVKTLIDLSQRESKNNSSTFANTAISIVKKSGIEILQNTHRFAGFAVLTAPDMASTLIELGYLSNKKEEKLLNSLPYKRKIIDALKQSCDAYFFTNEK